MFFKTVALSIAICASALTFTAPAHADSLTLTGVGGAYSDGVYVYPYIFTVSEGGKIVKSVALTCLNFDRNVSMGESWAVNEYAIPMGTGKLDGEDFASFRADAWLFNQYGTPGYTATEVQFAIWSIMDPTGVVGKQGYDDKAKSLATQAKAAAVSEPASYYANAVLFVPDTSNQQGWVRNGEPQIFLCAPNPIAPTPEPASLMLMGTGLISAVGMMKAGLRRGLAR